MKYLYVLLFTLAVNACSGQQSQKAEESHIAPPTFEMVSIPALITDPEERAEYLVKHYWDKFDFKDTTYIHAPQVTEQALSNYLDLTNHVSPAAMSSSVKALMRQAEQDSTLFRYFSEMMEKYLYNPDSPLRNEEMYIAVLEHLAESPSLSDVEKIRPAHLLELALKNRIGTPATDFTYTLANGQTGKLYTIKADYLLLFFYNPDCHACQEITSQIESSFLIDEFVKSDKLKILAIYPDEDLDAWKEHVSAMPKEWINSYDKSVSLKNDEIYDLKAIPTLYILDKEKKVLLKDATFPQIENYLSQTIH
ncbi:MAG: DUF5106 domain-containing protein [Parabacteroides sp.]|nr:DUF5106 domain-containing protein [Parabacteroides sp.]